MIIIKAFITADPINKEIGKIEIRKTNKLRPSNLVLDNMLFIFFKKNFNHIHQY